MLSFSDTHLLFFLSSRLIWLLFSFYYKKEESRFLSPCPTTELNLEKTSSHDKLWKHKTYRTCIDLLHSIAFWRSYLSSNGSGWGGKLIAVFNNCYILLAEKNKGYEKHAEITRTRSSDIHSISKCITVSKNW